MMNLSWYWGWKKIVIGGLLLLNAFVWPMWLGIDGWIKFIAVLMILGGVLKLVHPQIDCCMPVAKNVKKKKK